MKLNECIKSELKALLLGLEIGTTSKLVPTPEVKMSEVCVSASVNIQLDNEGKTTMTVSGFSNIELLMKHWILNILMHSVPRPSGNPPGGFSGKGVVEKKQLELICNKLCNEKWHGWHCQMRPLQHMTLIRVHREILCLVLIL